MYDKQSLVFGHRGAQAYAPMNTLPAFELAVAQGAHGIELDVQLSRDGYPMIMHNLTIDKTTDGSGRIAQKTLKQLKALDAGSWFDPKFANTRIPTLDEVFEAVGKQVFINVEIKSKSVVTNGVEQVITNCIIRHNMQTRVIVSSFNPHALMRFRALMPDVPLGFLYKPETPYDLQWVAANVPHEAYHPREEIITPELMADAARAGHLINAWVVNDLKRARELHDMGVRGHITDKPDVIRAAIDSW
jgi:glycerophosphoryl diester phosphodiesterase